MMKVLFVARYRDNTMHRKLELLAAEPDLQVRQICPRDWRDEHLNLRLGSGTFGGVTRKALGMLGSATDPHRSLYRSLTFGLGVFKPHIIHAEEEPESLAALQLAVARRLLAPHARLVLNTWQNQSRPTKWYVNAIRRATLRASTATFCASSEASELLRQDGYRRPAPVLPAIGVDTRIFEPGPNDPRPDPTFQIGYAGRLIPEKGLETLIDAIAHLAADDSPVPLQVTVIGNGRDRAGLEEQARVAGVGPIFQFVPSLPPVELAGRLRNLDVLVLPSRTTPTWKEQFGRVLTEAMACRVAVVGSNSGAIPEVIGPAGLVFPEGDAAALAACLKRLRDSPAERDALAAAGLARVQAHYTQEHVARMTAEYYREWLSTSPEPHAHHA